MKRTAILLIFMSIGWIQLYAQKVDKATKQKIETARIGLITERLNLTPEQAEKFWPLYKEFIQERNQLKSQYNDAKGKLDPQTATEEQKKALLDLGLKLKERSVGLERDYSDRMLKIISAEQIISLRKAEEDFRRMILNQIQRRRQAQQERRNRRDRIDDRIQNRRNN